MLKRFTPVLLFIAVSAAFVSTAAAETPAPGWEAVATTHPTNLSAAWEEPFVQIDVYNVGAAPSAGTVTVTDVLPKGLSATAAYGMSNYGEGEGEEEGGAIWKCSVTGGRVVKCFTDAPLPSGGLVRVTNGPLAHTDRLTIPVTVAPNLSAPETNVVTVAGGGAKGAATVTSPVVFSASGLAFGVADFDGWFSNVNGTVDTQAGSHPFAMTITFSMNDDSNLFRPFHEDPVHPRNITVNVPPGVVGDPTAIPQCPRETFDHQQCPPSTQIGLDRPASTSLNADDVFPLPVYNIVPPRGMPAQFGFTIGGINTFLDAAVRTGGDNGITEHVANIVESKGIQSNAITLWGVPAEPAHDNERCAVVTMSVSCSDFGVASSAERKPFLTLPTSCGAPPRFTIEASSWQEPDALAKAEFLMHNQDGSPTGFTGCERLVHFGPKVSIAPDTSFSDTPAGLGVEVRIPPDSNPEGLGSSGLKDTTVALPEGVVINPGQATGLVACQPSQEDLGGEGEEFDGPPSCPSASKVGTDEIETPLLTEKLQGSVYVLQQNPPNLQLLVVASAEGVNLKLVGNVHLNEQTGQLTTTFTETPDLPFTTFKLEFSGGAQAALATPVDCGVYSSSALFVPWSSPFIPNFATGSSVQIVSGFGGGACPSSPLPFAPSLIAGATTDQAGGFTSFSMLLQSGDGQQRIEKLQFKAPEGLAGMISSVPLCGEPQAAQGTCSAGSQIGHSIVASGPGPYPLTIPQTGDPESPIYLTGPYDGAPFGLSIVTHVIAGPFNLGTVITRAKIEIDPHTAQVTVTTDPLPQIIAGVPTDLRTVDAVIDRPGFMFNPTNCNPSSFSGTAWGTPPPGAGGPGATAPLSSHFQMGSCRSLLFNPDFTVSTSGKTSRVDGASLEAKIVYPPVPLGANQASGQANSASVKVELPKQLPSRLTTLQKACTSTQFNANPAGCPAASLIGHVEVITPVLPVPLMGPAYFVSNGGEAFPNLILVLQGDGVTVDLVGDTFISKAGITSSTFKTVPDVPFTSFDLKLPEGPFSALTADGNLCASKLLMPTTFVGQNGAEVHENTKIAVTGCAKHKKAAKHAKRGTARGKRTLKKR